MISLKLTRQELEAFRDFFFSYMELLQQTRINNVAHVSIQSDAYLSTIATNYIFREITTVVLKQLSKNKMGTQNLKFSEAQAIMLFRLLILIPMPANEFFLLKLHNYIIEELDRQFIEQAIYQQAVHKPEKTSFQDYSFFDE